MAGAYFGPQGIATDAERREPEGLLGASRRPRRVRRPPARCRVRLVAGRALRPRCDSGEVRDEHLDAFRASFRARRAPAVGAEGAAALPPVPAPSAVLEVPVCVHVTREPLESGVARCTQRASRPGGRRVVGGLHGAGPAGLGRPAAVPRALRGPLADRSRRSDAARQLEASACRVSVSIGRRSPRSSPRRCTATVERRLTGRAAERQQAALASGARRRRLLDASGSTRSLRGGAGNAARLRKLLRRDHADGRRREAAAEQHAVDGSDGRDRAREIQRAIDDGQDDVERQLRSLERSRAWRAAPQAMSRAAAQPQGRATRAATLRERAPPSRAGRRRSSHLRVHPRAGPHRRSRPTSSGNARVDVRRGVQLRRADPAPTSSDRPKVAVLAWDVGHNPLGRATCWPTCSHAGFDVEIWGAQFERYGIGSGRPCDDARHPDLRRSTGDRSPSTST